MINFEYIEYIISKYKNCKLKDILSYENKIEINLLDYLNKNQDFIQDSKAIKEEVFDYILDTNKRGYSIFHLSKKEDECKIIFILE